MDGYGIHVSSRASLEAELADVLAVDGEEEVKIKWCGVR